VPSWTRALLTLAAIVGKQACALGGLGAPLDVTPPLLKWSLRRRAPAGEAGLGIAIPPMEM
jgi:hypothetical protein